VWAKFLSLSANSDAITAGKENPSEFAQVAATEGTGRYVTET
jgi:hypothetical protein